MKSTTHQWRVEDLADGHAVGPLYPKMPANVIKSRALARAGKITGKEHGEKVLAAIREMQRRELLGPEKRHPCPCASGTWLSDGDAILREVNRQNRRI